ncbi:MAG: DUF1045 domain-containing protein [Rhizobiales bacterium]|nr:DUF1045 domain-containing protein [Hyphomicrobiales bacterium]
MSNSPRYAIYYTAERDSPLAIFGAECVGYDARTGRDVPFPIGVAEDWHDLTRDPRKYGFHATLKAPISLAPGRTEAELLNACADFAGRPRPLPVITPVVGAIGGFVAVIPSQPSDVLVQLAADCVGSFDPFRAPLMPADHARRRPEKLTPRQRDYLNRWGYPYVMEEFRFHMTLTGHLDVHRRADVLSFLQDRFARLALGHLTIDRITVFKQTSADRRFQVVREWQLLSSGDLSNPQPG